MSLNHPLLTRAEIGRDGILIMLEAETREARLKMLQMVLRSTQRFQQELEAEIAKLS